MINIQNENMKEFNLLSSSSFLSPDITDKPQLAHVRYAPSWQPDQSVVTCIIKNLRHSLSHGKYFNSFSLTFTL